MLLYVNEHPIISFLFFARSLSPTIATAKIQRGKDKRKTRRDIGIAEAIYNEDPEKESRVIMIYSKAGRRKAT